ncbi:amidase domain-containing protein [Jeotgalibacillus soli]|uniref:Putative amidase domain-containing protein n=1 Tax=Jeotgalibacillus soli TaxID=889306 RepID=A0A0C2VRW6_9BACL|nr:amidase domain-containing protein [Jeotgalibacillus soli]KIL46738.1 hypothetical protein KP78_18560 [Jeotgalibacillus soli]
MAYNPEKAVSYAERWWNSYNPAYPKFEVDCTNYISQCLFAGGWRMTGYPNRSRGWWLQGGTWSYSWSVANALRWYLDSGNRATRKQYASDLQLGDVICYDFEGDGRVNHTVIVTKIRSDGTPLVNAHTNNSRARDWRYKDSAAYTLSTQYFFYSIKP